MSDPRTERHTPQDEEESDFGSRLKVRLAIAGALVALALAAIPILDSLTGKKPQPAEATGNTIASSAAIAAPAEASATVASAPLAASAAASSQPAAGAPTGPNLSQTPGVAALPPLTPPPAAAPAQAPAPAGMRQSPTHAPQGQPRAPAAIVLPHEAGKALKPGYAAPQPAAPAVAARQQAPYQPVSPGAQAQVAPALPASLPARPAGSSIGYNVQLGLFSNIAELRSKGIEVQSETRVHLAPFRTKAEAEQAMAKLRAMGYAPMLAAKGN